MAGEYGVSIGLNYLVQDSIKSLTPNFSTGDRFNIAAGDFLNLTTVLGTTIKKYPTILYVDIYNDAVSADEIEISHGVPLPFALYPPPSFLTGRTVNPGESWRQDTRGFPWLFLDTVGGTNPDFVPNTPYPNPPVDPADPHGLLILNNKATPARGSFTIWGIA